MQVQIKLLKKQMNRVMLLLSILNKLRGKKIRLIFGLALGIGLGHFLFSHQYVENRFALLGILLFCSVLAGALFDAFVRIWISKCLFDLTDCACNLKIARLRNDLEEFKLYNQDKNSINPDWGNVFLTNIFEIVCIESKIESIKEFRSLCPDLPSIDNPQYTLESYVTEQNLDSRKLADLLNYLDNLNQFIKHKYPRIDQVEYLKAHVASKQLHFQLDYLLTFIGMLSLLEGFIVERYFASPLNQYKSQKELLVSISIEKLENYIEAIARRVDFYNTTFNLIKKFNRIK